MPTKDYDYITYDDRLFRLRFETPLDDLNSEQQFERGLQTVTETIDAFEPLLYPTAVEYVVSSADGDDSHEKKLHDNTGISAVEIIDSIRQTAESTSAPRLARLEFTGSVRITLSDGIHYFGRNGDLSDAEKRVTPSSDVSIPLEITIQQHDVMRPSQTEIVRIEGHSDHWLDGDEEKFYLSEATPLAKIDQSRLAAALSTLYDAVDPVEIVFDTFENTEGWHTPRQTVPAYQSLQIRHAVEWVFDNFERRQPDETSLEFEYTGDEVHPLVTHTQGSSPDEKVHLFLRKAIPEDRLGDGATATVRYPSSTATFSRDPSGKWILDDESNL